jgi:hypothetical protein
VAYFVVFALIIFLGLRGKEPNRQTFAVVALAAVAASAYELIKPS